MPARYRSPLTVFRAPTSALWVVSGMAVMVGNRAGSLMNPDVTEKVAAATFVVIGLARVVGAIGREAGR